MKSPVLTTATGQGYTSEKGFYIRVRKPVSHGLVNFTYGVFKETSKDGKINEIILLLFFLNIVLCETSNSLIKLIL